MANKSYLDYAGLKRVLKRLLPGNRKIWHGTWADWEQLSAAEKAEYDQAELTLGSFEQENLAIDTVATLNSLNPITSNAVNSEYNTNFGNVYNSAVFYGTVNNWRNNIPVTIANVPKGRYLIIGRCMNSSVGILNLSASTTSVGKVVNLVPVSNSSWTGDTSFNQTVIGYYEQYTDGNASITANIYSSTIGGRAAMATEAYISLLRIA